MKLTRNGYRERLIDKVIKDRLKEYCAVYIEGPKWCGKTWTALNNSNSAIFLKNSLDNYKDMRLAEMNLESVLNKESPETIDEWQEVPKILEAVQKQNETGKYILTTSTLPIFKKFSNIDSKKTCKLNMHTMSLYETGDSTGEVSLQDLFDNNVFQQKVEREEIYKIADYIVRGGWPEVVDLPIDLAMNVTKGYIRTIVEKDVDEVHGVNRDKRKMRALLKALAKNESTTVSTNALISGGKEDSQRNFIGRNTAVDYIDALDKLCLIKNQKSFIVDENSRENVFQRPKRHLVDPSLCCAILNLSPEKLLDDIGIFGKFFESLVERDLRIYSEIIGGKLYHYMDSKMETKVDCIVALPNGEYGAIEVNLGGKNIDKEAKNLKKFYDSVERKPSFMCIICGMYDAVSIIENGIYVLPITSLRP